MSNLKKFQAAISKLKEADSEIEDKILTDCKTMSKVENWVCVHATRYMPPRNSDGTMFLPTTAMVTNYDIPRTTVHVTLNHVVKSHAAGAWEDCPYVVFTPYTDLVRENGNPKCVSLYDTYFVPDSDRGLLLSPSAYIVQPSNGEFYEIGEHMATYKRGNYTEQEIKFILSLMPEGTQQRYKQFAEYTLDETSTNYYFNIRITDDNERQKILSTKYKQQMDKYAEDLLSSYLRDYVVRLAMESKGFQYLGSTDYRVGVAACEAVKDSGISTNAGPQSHFGSVERAMEDKWSEMHDQYITIFNEYEASELYKRWVIKPYENWKQAKHTDKPKIALDILGAIVNNEPINFYNEYCDKFASFAEDEGVATIAEYSPELDKALRKNAQILEKEFQEAVQILKQKPQYPKFERLAKRVLERCSKMNPGDSIIIPYWGPDNLEDGIDFEIPLPTKSSTAPIAPPITPIDKTRN